MAGRIKVELNRAGVGELLRSDWLAECCEEVAQRVVQAAGEGYEARSHSTGQRTIVNVYAATPEAQRDNLENNTLERALGGLRSD